MKNKLIKILVLTMAISVLSGCAKKLTDALPVNNINADTQTPESLPSESDDIGPDVITPSVGVQDDTVTDDTVGTSSEVASEDNSENITDTTTEDNSENTIESSSDNDIIIILGNGSNDDSDDLSELPTPEDELSFPYASEVPFDPAAYPDLAEQGDTPQEIINAIQNTLSQLTESYRENDKYFYGNCTVQSVTQKPRGEYCISGADVSTGNPEMDKIMNAVGYKDYYVTYLYNYGFWQTDPDAANVPISASLQIGDASYEYVFLYDTLIVRKSAEGEQYNSKVNDFIQNIYKLGCYYGEVLNVEKGRYNLYITDPTSQVYESDGKMIYKVQIQGMDQFYTFVLDENTKFSKDCDTGFFEGYEPGDTPLSWCKRAKANEEDKPLALAGVFDVKISGNHIDYLCGCYWWD